MKPERFSRTKSVMASSVIALIVAAVSFGIASAVLRPASSPFATGPGSAFTVSSAIYASPSCSGATVLLYPGATDCAVLTVHNNLSVPMTVQSLSTTIPSSSAGCPVSDFSLPTFSGNLSVPANGTVRTSGLPISLKNTGTNQDACQGVTLTLAYSGTAQYTDATSAALTTPSTTPTAGQPVTFTATVTGANASNDSSPPSGTVTFNRCPNLSCNAPKALGTAAIGSNGVATLTTSSLLPSDRYIQAVYPGSGTDYTGSTSPILTLDVAPPKTAASTTGGSGTAKTGGVSTSPSSIAFTGADIAGMVAGGLVLIGAGTFLVIASRRRHRATQP
jgi:Bacterial Ig-like domain (group 3)